MASVGLTFMPTDEELLNYLRKKVNGVQLPTHVFTECNIYGGDNREPWKLFDKSSNQTLYVFTPLNKKSKSRIDRVAGSGFWDCKSRKDQVKGLGFKKYLVFKNHPRNTENGNWVMHEFSLPNDDSYVLCKIRNKDPTTDPDDGGSGGGDSCVSKKRPLDVGQEDQPRKKMRIGSSSAVHVVQEPVVIAEEELGSESLPDNLEDGMEINDLAPVVLEVGPESFTNNLEDGMGIDDLAPLLEPWQGAEPELFDFFSDPNEVIDKDYLIFLNSLI